MQGFQGLRQVLGSRQGVLALAVSATGALALGLLPVLVQAVPQIGKAWWWIGLVTVGAVVGLAVSANLLYAKRGVGVVLFFPEAGWDSKLREHMRQDALSRHPQCFAVEVPEMFQETAAAVQFGLQLMQSRLGEAEQGQGLMQPVSLYLVARHRVAYEIGRRMQKPRADVVVRGWSGSRRCYFDMARLDGPIHDLPGAAERSLVEGVLEAEPKWVSFEGEDGAGRLGDGRRRSVALVLSLAGHNVNMVPEALQAARKGGGHGYEVPGGQPCVGALVMRIGERYVPESREHFEALVRYVTDRWTQQLRAVQEELGCTVRGVLFTDGPAPLLLTLGTVLRQDVELAPFDRSAAAAEQTTQAASAHQEQPLEAAVSERGTAEAPGREEPATRGDRDQPVEDPPSADGDHDRLGPPGEVGSAWSATGRDGGQLPEQRRADGETEAGEGRHELRGGMDEDSGSAQGEQ